MTQPPDSLIVYFTRQHREADDLWADVERSSEGDAASDLVTAFAAFERSVLSHLRSEEEILFPAFEAATGMTGGPTTMMRMEHVQLRALLEEMRSAMQTRNQEALLDLGDTFNTLVQQHNMKEERMLYRMSEQAVGDGWPAMHDRLRSANPSR